MTRENLIQLAKQNLDSLHNESDLAEYLAFLFSELSELDSDWNKTLESDVAELESN
tara:strand:- start:330 stop:497 length:168 start_codon:yes stop_codon:yes gene_type:complete